MPLKANLILHTYTRQSPTVDGLKKLLDCRRVFTDTTEVAAVPNNSLIVNWGASRLHRALGVQGVTVLNKPEFIHNATDKLRAHALFSAAHVPTPALTRDRAQAARWLREDGRVLVRENEGYAGMGITVATNARQLEAADGDFFSRFLDKTHEYRFHVFQGTVIDMIEKRLDPNLRRVAQLTAHQMTVFNHDNGYKFYRENIRMSPEDRALMDEAAIAAVRALRLDFGGVDMLARYDNGVLQGFAVCEVNTAPALDGDQAKQRYVQPVLASWAQATGGGALVEHEPEVRARNRWA